MSGHTPGPWSILDTSIIAKEAGVVVADMSVGLRMHPNARLIAAAPELLEAAKAVHEAWVERSLNAEVTQLPDPIAAINALLDAVAKAEGGGA